MGPSESCGLEIVRKKFHMYPLCVIFYVSGIGIRQKVSPVFRVYTERNRQSGVNEVV